MEVILQETISTLGKAGEIVKVKEGYARNYLLPLKKAVLANRKNVKELDHHQKAIAAKQSKLVAGADSLKAKLEGHAVTIAKETGEEDKLFGSVTSHEIAESLTLAGYTIDKKMIHLEHPIKAIGVFDVPVRLHSEVTATVKVWVVKK
jgi:large subunit ribosomal protein L9